MFKQSTEFLTLDEIFVNIIEQHKILRLSQMYSLWFARRCREFKKYNKSLYLFERRYSVLFALFHNFEGKQLYIHNGKLSNSAL